jgi:type I restriction enzyme S subunit
MTDCVNRTAPVVDFVTPYKMIRTTNVKMGRIDTTNVKYVTEDIYTKWTRRGAPQVGDVVLTREAPLGEIGIVRTNDTIFLGQRLIQYRAKPNVLSPQFLYYSLQGEDLQGQIRSKGSGATVEHMRLPDCESLEVPLPPLPTQRKIAAILSGYDDLIENNTRRIQILEEMMRSLYREWFLEFRPSKRDKVPNVPSSIGMIPHLWNVGKLGDIAYESRVGVHPSAVAPDTPYIGLEHLPRRSIALGEWGQASDVASTKLRFEQNDILFGKIRPYFHKVGVTPVSGVCSTDAIVIRPKEASYFSFVLCCVSSDPFILYSVQTSNGTKMPRANWEVMSDYTIPIPPHYVLEQFGEIISPMVTTIQNLVLRDRNLRRTRNLLLPKLVSGEVDVSYLDIRSDMPER